MKNAERLPLAYLAERPVYESDLDLTWKEIVKAVVGWLLIFGSGIAFIAMLALLVGNPA